MGSYAGIDVGEYSIFQMKSYVSASLMSVFIEKDRVESSVGDIDDGIEKQILYRTTVKIAKKRLEIMGYTLDNLKSIFLKTKSEYMDDYNVKEDINYEKFLKNFSFEDYLRGLNKIYTHKISIHGDYWILPNIDEFRGITDEGLQSFIEGNLDVKFILGEFEYIDQMADLRYYLRGFLDNIDGDECFYTDVSELIHSGYYDNEDEIAKDSLGSEDKIILFTEGPYDTKVIQNSMQLLYPEYYPYFTFLDIDGPSLQMGADRLVSYQKSFISAGITNKTIFLFDNDTAGHKDKKSLLKLKNIPDNFVIKTYPDIDIAKLYPTICPNGLQNLDINGKGASIELYLCNNILQDENGKYIPIQWKAYNDSMKEFQGGFSQLHKSKIQKEFGKILKECQKDRASINKYNFNSLDLLLNDIFKSYL